MEGKTERAMIVKRLIFFPWGTFNVAIFWKDKIRPTLVIYIYCCCSVTENTLREQI